MPKSFATLKFSGKGFSRKTDELELLTFVEGEKALNGAPVSEGDALVFDLKGSVPGRSIWGEGVTLEVDGQDGPGLTTDQLRAGVALPAPAFEVSLRGRLGNGRDAVHGAAFVPGGVEEPAPPVAKGTLADLTLTEESGAHSLDAATDFVGDALVYSLPLTLPGVSVEASTGLVTIDTDASGRLAGATVVARATNPAGSADSAFSLTVEAPANTAPVAVGDKATVTAGGSVRIDVLANDSDLDGDDLQVTGVSTDIGRVSIGPAPGYLLEFDASDLSAGDVATITYILSDGTDTATGEVDVAVEASHGALYESILALSDPANAGRTSTAPLTVVDTANPPAGMYYRGDIEKMVVDGDNVVFEDMDFRGIHVSVQGANVTFRQCIFGYKTGEPTSASHYYIEPDYGADTVLFEDCTCDGGGGESNRGSCVVFSGIAGEEANAPKDVTFRRVRIVNAFADFIKPGGVRTLFDRVYLGEARNIPERATYYDANLAYNPGDIVLYPANETSYRMYEAQQPVPAGEEPSGGANNEDTAFWKNRDRHLDGFQAASFKDMTIRDTLIEMFSHDAGGNLKAVGITNSLRFAPNTNRARCYENLLISGLVIAAPYGGHNPISFSTNIRGWQNNIVYSTGVQKYCRVGCAVFQSLIDDNLGNDPLLTPSAWTPVRDYAMPGPLRVEHLWISNGRNGAQGLFNSQSSFPISSQIRIDPTGDPFPDSTRPNLEIVEDRSTPVFATARLATDERVQERFEPAQEFVITPLAYKTVLWAGKRISAVPLYVGGIGVGAIGQDGSLYTVDGEGVALADNGGGTFSLSLYDHEGNAMEGSLQIPAGAAAVTSRTASVITGGPKWGRVDDVAPTLSNLSTVQSTDRIDWTVTTDEGSGKLFGILLPSEADTPAPDEVIAGTDSNGNPAKAVFEVEVTAEGTLSGSIPNLSEATEYGLHIVQRDEALNVGACVSVAVHTEASERLASSSVTDAAAPRLTIPNGLAAGKAGEITVLVRMAVGDGTNVNTVHRFIEALGREFTFWLDLRLGNAFRCPRLTAEEGGSNGDFLAVYGPVNSFGKIPATFLMSITLDDGAGNATARIWKNGVLLAETTRAAPANTSWAQRDIYMDFMPSVEIAVNDFAVWRAFTPDGSLPDDTTLIAPRLTGDASVFNAPPAPYKKSGPDFA